MRARAIKCLAKLGAVGKGASEDALKLAKSLASQRQMAEAGAVMAGPGSSKIFRDAGRIANTYGGNPSNWVKKASSTYTAADGAKFSTHWVENVKTGQRVEFKTRFSD